jgi:hypothetical protein
VNDESKKVSSSLAVWVVLFAGALAIPVGLVGWNWLDRANTARIGFTQRVTVPRARVDRACTERALSQHFGPRQVRTYDDALLVQLPASQYQRTPERMHVVVRAERGQRPTDGGPSVFLVETAFYKERPVVARYDEAIAGAMSELVDVIVRGCATDPQLREASQWTAQCTAGPGFTRACPSLRPGATLAEDLRLPVRRD